MPKKAQAEVKSAVETITPQQAERWLGHNTHNRPMRSGLAERFATAMHKGEWQLNGESIKFDWNGVLVDGQHRLWAVIESGATIQSLVVHNLPPQVQETVDTGAMRNVGDMLHLRGHKRGSVLAAAARYLFVLERGMMRTTGGGMSRSEVSPQDLFEVVGRYPSLPTSIDFTDPLPRYLGGSFAQYAALHTYLGRIDGQAADDFFGRLIDGLELTEGSPVYALRQWLERNRAHSSNFHRLNRLVVHAMFVKAWNAYRKGQAVKQLRYSMNEDLPVAI